MLWKTFDFSKALLLFTFLVFPSTMTMAQNDTANPLVSGILSYVIWDQSLQNINFCIIDGEANFISKNIFSPPSQIIIQPPYIKVFNYYSDQFIKTTGSNTLPSCQVLYFVKTPDDIQQQIINLSPIKTLSISENNQDCVIGSSFCIYKQNKNYRFKVNLDSLKRSQVRVNSKVLFLSQLQEEKE